MAKTRATEPADAHPADESVLHKLRHNAEPEPGALPGDVIPPLGPLAVLSRKVILIGVLPAFSIFYLWQALTIPLPTRTLLVSPRGFPTFIGIIMTLVAITLAILEVRKILQARRAVEGAPVLEGVDDDDPERITSWRDAWITVGALAVYIATFSFLGFFIATTLFLIGLSTYFARKNWLRNIIVSVLFSLAVFLLFSNVLAVRLPAGLLGGIF